MSHKNEHILLHLLPSLHKGKPSVAARAAFLWLALTVGIPAAAIANPVDAPSSEPQPASGYARLPDDIRPAILMLMTRLEAAGVSQEVQDAARAFLDYTEANPDVFGRDVSELDAAGRDKLAQAASQATVALSGLAEINAILAEKEWLRRANPELADMIVEQCGRREMDEVDMFRVADLVIKGQQELDGPTRNLLDDLSGTARECVERLQETTQLAAQENLRLDAVIKELERRIEEEDDPEVKATLEAELEKARNEQREVKESFDLLGALTFLAGLASFVAGVAGVIASAGSCVPCYYEVAGGAAAMGKGYDMMQGETFIEPVTVPARYPGVDPSAVPSPVERSEVVEAIKQDDRFTYIPPPSDEGNFVIVREEATGDLLILQIAPEMKITIDLDNPKAVKFGASSDNAAMPPDRIGDVEWSLVADPFVVEQMKISLVLEGSLDGKPVSVSFVQNPVSEPFLATAQRR